MIGICVKVGARVTCQSRTGEAFNISREFLFLNVNRELDKFTIMRKLTLSAYVVFRRFDLTRLIYFNYNFRTLQLVVESRCICFVCLFSCFCFVLRTALLTQFCSHFLNN